MSNDSLAYSLKAKIAVRIARMAVREIRT
jgi:hypothetical protein